MGVHTTTELTCPLCGNSWVFVHHWSVQPEVGSCDRCATHFSTGTNARGMIEHRRPKNLFWVRPVPESER